MIYIGISGWTYAGWRGKFYPKGLVHRCELEFASRHFNSIEINGTHYGLQKPKSFATWYSQTPPGFVFSVKASRYITHVRRLKDIEEPLANFFASGVLALREKLGPFLWQFPPSFRYERERMERFFELLPQTTTGAASLARKHGANLDDRCCMKPGPHHALRHCIEIRHESFLNDDFFKLLRQFGVAFVFADSAGKWPFVEDLTSNFVYLRLHGAEKLYTSGYNDEALRRWARRIQSWTKGHQIRGAVLQTSRTQSSPAKKDAFVYFDNDRKVFAPRDALRLEELLK